MKLENLPPEAQAAIVEDTKLWDELVARIGLEPAAVISECVNLVAMVQRGAPMQETVLNLLDHVIKGFKLDRDATVDYIHKALAIRTVRISAASQH